jgi:hypothetical protein
LVRRADFELALKHIRSDRQFVTRIGRSTKSTLSAALNAVLTHHAFDSLPANTNTARSQFAMNARAAVRASTSSVCRHDFDRELSI